MSEKPEDLLSNLIGVATKMAEEVNALRSFAATCYAGLGAECNLTGPWLDALLNASQGRSFSTDGLLPYEAVPIDMVLHCPVCGMQHIDDPKHWNGKVEVHRSHLCVPAAGGCGHVWRPADVATNGVAAVKTQGKADSPIWFKVKRREIGLMPNDLSDPIARPFNPAMLTEQTFNDLEKAKKVMLEDEAFLHKGLITAEQILADYFENRNIKEWKYGRVQSRLPTSIKFQPGPVKDFSND